MAKQIQQRPTRKTESLTVRLDPKVKFGLELMSRLQNRTVTGVVEWALTAAMTRATINPRDEESATVTAILDEVWSTDEPLRLVRLAFRAPNLLTYEELRIWETIQESPRFWDSPHRDHELYVDFATLRADWDALIEHVHKHENDATIAPMIEDIPF